MRSGFSTIPDSGQIAAAADSSHAKFRQLVHAALLNRPFTLVIEIVPGMHSRDGGVVGMYSVQPPYRDQTLHRMSFGFIPFVIRQ
jgi:hypothetical protein